MKERSISLCRPRPPGALRSATVAWFSPFEDRATHRRVLARQGASPFARPHRQPGWNTPISMLTDVVDEALSRTTVNHEPGLAGRWRATRRCHGGQGGVFHRRPARHDVSACRLTREPSTTRRGEITDLAAKCIRPGLRLRDPGLREAVVSEIIYPFRIRLSRQESLLPQPYGGTAHETSRMDTAPELFF